MTNDGYDEIFASHGSHTDLKKSTFSGVAYSVLGSFTQMLVTFVSLAILARLLSKADYGIVAMAMPVIVFLSMFADLGLGTPAIQKKDLTHQQASTLFWVGLAFASTLFVLCGLTRFAIADFYHEPRVANVFLALSFGLVISALQSQHSALPSWGTEMNGLMNFGLHVTLFGFLSFLSGDMDKVILGRTNGAVELGLYIIAFRLFMMPVQTVVRAFGNVMLPAMSRLQEDAALEQKYYITMIGLLAYFMGPPIITIAILSKSVLVSIIGAKWQAAAPILSVLSIIAFIQIFYISITWIHLAGGNAYRNMKWALIATPVFLTAFLIGARWGGFGVASLYTLANLILVIPAFAYALKGGSMSGRAIFTQAALPALLSALVTAAIIGLYKQLLVPALFPLSALVFGALICLLTMALFSWVYFGKEQLHEHYRSIVAMINSVSYPLFLRLQLSAGVKAPSTHQTIGNNRKRTLIIAGVKTSYQHGRFPGGLSGWPPR